MNADMHLAAFVADLQWRDVPVDVAQKVVRHVLDALGVMCAGLSDPSSAAVRSVASEAGSSLEASIVGSAMGGSAPLAAFVNAFHGRIHTFDDTYEAGPVHAGVVVLSSALAAGQRWPASGVDVLTAVLAGHEVAVRVANALGPGHYASGFHCTGTCNALGAAAAAARVMGLDLDGVVGALGHAGGAAAGLRERLPVQMDRIVNTKTPWKPSEMLHSGETEATTFFSPSWRCAGSFASCKAAIRPKNGDFAIWAKF